MTGIPAVEVQPWDHETLMLVLKVRQVRGGACSSLHRLRMLLHLLLHEIVTGQGLAIAASCNLQMTLKVADLGHLTSSIDVHKQWVSRLEEVSGYEECGECGDARA